MRNLSGRGTTSNRRYRSRAWEITTARLSPTRLTASWDHLRFPIYATDKFDVIDHMPLLSGVHNGDGRRSTIPTSSAITFKLRHYRPWWRQVPGHGSVRCWQAE